MLWNSLLWILWQTSNTPEMADALRQSGKIYLVVAVILVIFAGIIFYLFRIENQLKKYERHSQHLN